LLTAGYGLDYDRNHHTSKRKNHICIAVTVNVAFKIARMDTVIINKRLQYFIVTLFSFKVFNSTSSSNIPITDNTLPIEFVSVSNFLSIVMTSSTMDFLLISRGFLAQYFGITLCLFT